MILLQASHIQKSFGAHTVLDDVTLTIQETDRTGLVGANGAGKSTLLKILIGQSSPDAGEIIKPKEVTLGYLAQNSQLDSGRTVWDEMLEVFRPLLDMEEQIRKMEQNLSSEETMARYDALAEEFRTRGGYSYRADIGRVLKGLKFSEDYFPTPVNTLSGGQKTRLALARMLLLRPSVLVLDEPTNYLDIETLAWLEQHLKSYPGAILAVSHDRYFLDQLAQAVYELEFGRLTRYPGNYTRFMQLKEEQVQQQNKLYNKQQDEIARLEEFVRRNIARASTTARAKSRQKMLEKIDRVEKPATQQSARFSFNVHRQGAMEVLKIKDMSIGYRGTPLARQITFEITRGERVALVGPNGAGKTTLLKTIAGRLGPLKGHFLLGTNVSIGYYEQEQAAMESSRRLLDEVWDNYPFLDEKDVRTLLGNFLFRGDDVFKAVSELSGGERARISLAKLMLQRANFLLLDEPTNHLDLYSKEVLEEALRDYPGTILFVSHDRYFLNKIATRVLELHPEGVSNYHGNYDYYLYKKAQSPPGPGPEEGSKGQAGEVNKEAKTNYLLEKEAKRQHEKRQRRISELEKVIEDTEKLIASLEEELYLTEVNQDLELLMKKNNRLEQLKATMENFYLEWVELTEEAP